MNIMIKVFVLAFTLAISSITFSQVTDFGDVDPSRLASEQWTELTWSNPGSWTTYDVTENGLPANSSTVDASLVVQTIIQSNSGPIRLYFPAGTYTFNTNLVITRGNIWISGDGPATEFVLDAPSSDELNIRFKGTATTNSMIQGDIVRGDTSFSLVDVSGFGVGDYVEVFASDSGLKSNTEAGQIAQVVSKSGSTITINDKFGVPISITQSPMIRRLEMVENIRVEDIRLERVRDNGGRSFNLHFDHASNILVKGIESFKSAKHHIELATTYRAIVEDSSFDDNWDNGGGGHGYGISGVFNATKARITNNTLINLRHPLNVHFGANHFVIAYNNATNQDGHPNAIIAHGRGAHNNLFEGNFSTDNIVKDCAHGADWRFNTFFRNRGKDVGDICGTTDYTNIIGNEYTGNLRDAGASNYVGGNLRDGHSVSWGALPTNADIPPSLYAVQKPSYVSSWPLYGPESGSLIGGSKTNLIEGLNPTKQSSNWVTSTLQQLTDGLTDLEAYASDGADTWLQWNFSSDVNVESIRFYQDNAGNRQLEDYRIRIRRNGIWNYQGDWSAADQAGWQDVAVTAGTSVERIQVWFRPESGGVAAAYEIQVIGEP